jgi:hypothetical protein
VKSSIRTFWGRLEGSVHPDDKLAFAENPHSFNLEFPPPAFVGDIDNAPIIILMANGGYHVDRTPTAFLDDMDHQDYRDYLAGRSKERPARLPKYYTREKWFQDGSAVFVNAVAYRSRRISSEPANKRLAQILPSSIVHRRWLMDEVIPAVRSDKRMVVAHRHGLWDLDRQSLADCPNFIFSTNPASPFFSKATRERVNVWLGNRPS